ncbi:hypothetical protein ACFY4C_05855 [Actinomadura viridis]|uniref:hypothetical protein n=1 Tax=Actinomadura viridis TaxID=58110 RepID=UPI0036883A4E
MTRVLLGAATWAAFAGLGVYILGGLTGRWLWRRLTDLLDGPYKTPSGGPQGAFQDDEWYFHPPEADRR